MGRGVMVHVKGTSIGGISASGESVAGISVRGISWKWGRLCLRSATSRMHHQSTVRFELGLQFHTLQIYLKITSSPFGLSPYLDNNSGFQRLCLSSNAQSSSILLDNLKISDLYYVILHHLGFMYLIHYNVQLQYIILVRTNTQSSFHSKLTKVQSSSQLPKLYWRNQNFPSWIRYIWQRPPNNGTPRLSTAHRIGVQVHRWAIWF